MTNNALQWTPLNMATSCQAKMAIITDGLHYPKFLFGKQSKQTKFLKQNWLDIIAIAVAILSGVYCCYKFNNSILMLSQLRLCIVKSQMENVSTTDE